MKKILYALMVVVALVVALFVVNALSDNKVNVSNEKYNEFSTEQSIDEEYEQSTEDIESSMELETETSTQTEVVMPETEEKPTYGTVEFTEEDGSVWIDPGTGEMPWRKE